MEKIKLELDDLEVTSFAMQRAPASGEGTVIAHSTIEGCGPTLIRNTCLCDPANE